MVAIFLNYIFWGVCVRECILGLGLGLGLVEVRSSIGLGLVLGGQLAWGRIFLGLGSPLDPAFSIFLVPNEIPGEALKPFSPACGIFSFLCICI